MNRRPGHVDVTTEVGFCNFCQRPRNLRTEAHHLGTLVRTIVTCETCHRTLSSTMGVARAPEPEPVKAAAPAPDRDAVTTERGPTKRAAAKKPAATKKPTSTKKSPTAAKKAPPAKPRSTATRKTTRAR